MLGYLMCMQVEGCNKLFTKGNEVIKTEDKTHDCQQSSGVCAFL